MPLNHESKALLLRKIKRDFKNQRQLAKELKFSPWKIKLLFAGIKKEGLVKIDSFNEKNPKKLRMF